MPGKSGLEFIRDYKENLNTPIILLTAKGQADERVEGLEIGAESPEEIAIAVLAEILASPKGVNL